MAVDGQRSTGRDTHIGMCVPHVQVLASTFDVRLVIMATTRLIFVYGTLMSTATGAYGAGARRRLASESRPVGWGTVEGRLYDLGSYPGLVVGEGSGGGRSLVRGEIRELGDAEAVWPWLDRYEGIAGGDSAGDDYRREVRLVLPDGQSAAVAAWLYVYQGPLAGASVVAAGFWRPG